MKIDFFLKSDYVYFLVGLSWIYKAIEMEEQKENIPDLDLSVEGIIEGRDFYAKDALQYHFIDGIMNLASVVEFVKNEARKRESILSTF